jgi:hypothetical protein
MNKIQTTNGTILVGEADCFTHCGNKRTNILVKGINPYSKNEEMFATSICVCQKSQLLGNDRTWFDAEMTITLIRKWLSGQTKREYSQEMFNQFSGKAPFLSAGELRPGKDEWRSECTQKIENIRSAKISDNWKTLFDSADVTDELIGNCAANSFRNRIIHKPNVWKAFGRDAQYQADKETKRTLNDY